MGEIKMISVNFTLSTTYQKLSTLIGASALSPLTGRDGEKANSLKDGFIRNRDATISVFVASGYATSPADNHGELLALKSLKFRNLNPYQTWVKAASGTPVIDLVVGSDGIL